VLTQSGLKSAGKTCKSLLNTGSKERIMYCLSQKYIIGTTKLLRGNMLNIKTAVDGLICGFMPGVVLSFFMYETLRNPLPYDKGMVLFTALSAGVFLSMLIEHKGKLGVLMPFILFGQVFSKNYIINSLSLGMALYYCLAMIFSGDYNKVVVNVFMAALGFLGTFVVL